LPIRGKIYIQQYLLSIQGKISLGMADSWPEIWRQYFWSHDGNKKFLFQAKNIANVM
jgi:hypothetical protein